MEIRDVLDRHAKNKNEERERKKKTYLFIWHARIHARAHTQYT